jgi:sterol desaturase/sphingolipid hydroxylase (fatty acid hydroxylase superfamily)
MAAGVNSCMDRYAAAPADDKAAQINLLWSIYYLCDAMISRKLLYEEQVIRNENFVFQRYENTIIMLMVVSITISGVILAGLQLFASYKLASVGKATFADAGEVTIDSHSLAVKSSVVGVIILAISFAFFLVFVLYVYTFTPVSNSGATASSSPPQAPQSRGSGTETDHPANVGKALPALSSPAENH